MMITNAVVIASVDRVLSPYLARGCMKGAINHGFMAKCSDPIWGANRGYSLLSSMLSARVITLPPYTMLGVAHSSAVPVIIGEKCRLGPEVHIAPFTSIGDGCTLQNVKVDNSIIIERVQDGERKEKRQQPSW